MKAAWRLDIGRSHRLIVCTEIDGTIADSAGPADHVQTLAPHPPSKAFVTACGTFVAAWLMDAIAFTFRVTAGIIAHDFSA